MIRFRWVSNCRLNTHACNSDMSDDSYITSPMVRVSMSSLVPREYRYFPQDVVYRYPCRVFDSLLPNVSH